MKHIVSLFSIDIMKKISICLTVLVVLCVVEGYDRVKVSQLNRNMRNNTKQCTEESNTTQGQVLALTDGVKTREQKCFVACMYRKINMTNSDGGPNTVNCEQLANIFLDKSDHMEKIKKDIQICTNKASELSSPNKYETEYWGEVSRAVGQILHNSPRPRVSFEQMYSIVYKCVCDGFAEKMHSDLLAQCSLHLDQVNRSLDTYEPRIQQQCEDESIRLVLSFHEILELYLIAVQQITPIFAYMNKFYVEVLLQTSLQTELMELFRRKVSDRRMDVIMASVEELLLKPFALSPATVSSMFANLHCVGRGEYGRCYPHLFARYVPGVLPPMKESDIESHIRETQELQCRLRGESGEAAAGSGRKRRGDDENYGPTVCCPAPQQFN